VSHSVCSGECVAVSVARLPDEPRAVAHSLLVGTSDITVRLSWQQPVVAVADPPITGYRVVWGPVLPPANHLLMDQSSAESRELPKVHFLLNLTIHGTLWPILC